MSEPAETSAPRSRLRRVWLRIIAVGALLTPALAFVAANFESLAKIAKSGKDICEVVGRCETRPENGTVIVQAPSLPPPAPSREPPIDQAILRAPQDSVIRSALTTTKLTSPESVETPRDTTFDDPRRGRIVTAASEERISLCGRPEMVVLGPERNGTDQVQLRKPGVLPSERRDVAVELNVATDIGTGCVIRVTRSGDRRPLYSFEEITR